ncbi:hypothetical protein WR25_19955 [Diploscapter pachys]|uniref:Dolichyl-diphosphooligosaccharide--protein glycosyltransferase subunit 2 n=1 Tax=Diploscapter pachys TaxID=2018661 RepID=A0A2A2KAY9_9BILA|nr:hypothetical protein WR25_19955 [Diploscapter pachys]
MKFAILLTACGILLANAATEQAGSKKSYDANVLEFRVGVLEKDGQPDGTNTHNVALFSKYASVIESDHTKRIHISFKVQDKATGSAVKPHQVFVIFEHSPSAAEVVYVADAVANGYTLDINLPKSHTDFDGLSGSYKARLVIGDGAIKKSIDWHFADFKLSVPAQPDKPVPKSQQIIYETLPEIQHKFRQPEKRPPSFVSDTFTIVCLAPLALLLILWLGIGINFGNLPLSLWPLLFHGGLCGLFGLYFVFWLRLNMFETLKYLALIGAFTFIAGNRVLRSLANSNKLVFL